MTRKYPIGLSRMRKQHEHFKPDIALQVGEVTEQVTVVAEAPLIETETSALTHVVDQKKILELPLNGRNFLELAALSAGSSPKTPFRVTQFGNRNQYVTIGGGRDSSTNYLIDGVEARSLRFNNSSIQPSVDAIQEFKVERNSFSAEYGRGVAVVNVAIRSGGRHEEALRALLDWRLRCVLRHHDQCRTGLG